MAHSKSLISTARFRDCHYVMEKALETPGLLYQLPTTGDAINFKHRCNQYRKILREKPELELAGRVLTVGETAFDVLVIRQVNAAGDSDRRGQIIRFDHQATPSGILIDPETQERTQLDPFNFDPEASA